MLRSWSRRSTILTALAGALSLLEPASAKRKRKKRMKRRKKKPDQTNPTPPVCRTYTQSITAGCSSGAQCCSGSCWPIPAHCLHSVSGQGCLSTADCAFPLVCSGYRCR